MWIKYLYSASLKMQMIVQQLFQLPMSDLVTPIQGFEMSDLEMSSGTLSAYYTLHQMHEHNFLLDYLSRTWVPNTRFVGQVWPTG